MGPLGFFDADKRLQALPARGDPLEAIDHLVPWESFRAEIEAVVLTPDELKKSSAGRKPFDAILMFRMLVLQALNNLSDEQVEYQVRDRLSFSRFLGLAIEDSVPDATTLWPALSPPTLAKNPPSRSYEKLSYRQSQLFRNIAVQPKPCCLPTSLNAPFQGRPPRRGLKPKNQQLFGHFHPTSPYLAGFGLVNTPETQPFPLI